jgi:hypothetical protein
MKQLKSFGLFWWDFVVGDDWRMAAGVIVLLGVASFIAHRGVPTWWLPPLGVIAVLTYSLSRVVRRH